MNKANHIICTHSGLLFATLLGVAFITAGWLPPVPPNYDAATVASIFQEDNLRIKLGATALAVGGIFWLPFSAAIAMQMSRMEGKMPIFSVVQVIASACLVLVLLSGSYSWIAGAYRVEMIPATLVQKMSDLGWIWFVAAFPPLFMQNAAMGLCILTSESAEQIFPRWAGYANLWFALLAVPGIMVPFFYSGPFAWNGLIAFWVPVAAFGFWFVMMWHLNLKAISK